MRVGEISGAVRGRALRAAWSGCCGTEHDSWRRRWMAVRGRSTLTHTFVAHSVAVSGVMAAVLGQIRVFAPAETVVFEGATGTGKSYLAEALHEASDRRGAFVDVSAGEFEPGLALDQLFGHVRGAFTGALSRHRGLFAEAEAGTLLIDEFHLLRHSQQAMLIRAPERRVYRPIGYERDVPVTCGVLVGVEEGLLGKAAERIGAHRNTVAALVAQQRGADRRAAPNATRNVGED